jgi:glutaconate CoA-transferase subunit B
MEARNHDPVTPQELMITAAAREIQDNELVFVGMRLPLLAFMLAKATHATDAVGLYENGVIRSHAVQALLYTMSDTPNIDGATRAGDMLEVMGLLQSGRVGLGFVGAAEVDRFGNLNTTQTTGTRLPGSGGACDIACLSQRLVVVISHRKHRLVPKVGHVTSPGFGTGPGWRESVGLVRGGPVAMITDLGVLRFDPDSREAELASFHADSPQDVVTETGWPLRVRDDVHRTALPSNDELEILRSIDPERVWLGA